MSEFIYTCRFCDKVKTIEIDDDAAELIKDLKLDMRFVCSECEPKTTQEKAKVLDRTAAEFNQRKSVIERYIPEVFRECDMDRFPQSVWGPLSRWVPADGSVYICGPPGSCKSRMVYTTALRYINLGKRVFTIDSREFRAAVERGIQDRGLWAWYSALAENDLVVFDDLGKWSAAVGKRVEEEFFNFIKMLHERKVPMLITSNYLPAQLRDRKSVV